MAIGFKQALGIHQDALQFRVKRAEVLANNLANADTPGFKARDLEFSSLLDSTKQGLALAKTDHAHLEVSNEMIPYLQFRNPSQPSIDGNTVDTNVEVTEFSRNAMDFEASFQFLNSKFRGLRSAIKGE